MGPASGLRRPWAVGTRIRAAVLADPLSPRKHGRGPRCERSMAPFLSAQRRPYKPQREQQGWKWCGSALGTTTRGQPTWVCALKTGGRRVGDGRVGRLAVEEGGGSPAQGCPCSIVNFILLGHGRGTRVRLTPFRRSGRTRPPARPPSRLSRGGRRGLFVSWDLGEPREGGSGGTPAGRRLTTWTVAQPAALRPARPPQMVPGRHR